MWAGNYVESYIAQHGIGDPRPPAGHKEIYAGSHGFDTLFFY